MLMSARDACRFHDWHHVHLWMTYARLPAKSLVSLARYRPGLISASGFERPASTLPTRFPAALDIGHSMPAAYLMHAH